MVMVCTLSFAVMFTFIAIVFLFVAMNAVGLW